MKFTEGQLKAAELWRVAEGRPNKQGERPDFFEKSAAQLKLAESVASGEFLPQILPAVRRTVQVVYDNIEQTHQQWTTRKTVQAIDVDEEFNVFSFGDQSKMEGTHMGDTFINGGLPALGPRELYPTLGFTASGKKLRASKFGEAFGVDWESIVRSRGAAVDLIRQGFTAFGEHAKNQEDINAYKLLVGSGGFKTASGQALNSAKAATTQNGFSVANADLANPEDFQAAIALSNTAVLTVGTGTTVNTIPVNYTNFVLITSPANAPRLRQAMAARRITRVPATTGTDSAKRQAEWEETIDLGGQITVLGSEWFKRLFPTAGRAWVLVPLTSGETSLPLFTSNYLEGNEQPQVFIRDSNSTSLSGGRVNPLVDGDFDNDAATTKVRHVHGATPMWTDGVVYSLGTNA